MAQDIHFSQFFNAPIINNPANAGLIKEDFRFAGIQRVQWQSISDNPYNTLGLSADMSEPLGLQNTGAGISILHDLTGDSRYKTLDINLSLSRQFYLSSDSVHSLSSGLLLGFSRKSIDYTNLQFDRQYNGAFYDPNLSSNETFSNQGQSFINLGLGGTYMYNRGNRLFGEVGMSLFNINKPRQSFFNDDDIRRDRRFLLQLRGGYPINYDLDIQPTVAIMFQGKYKEIILGSLVKYTLVNARDDYRALYAGLLYRNSDAGYLYLGMDYDSWTVGLSYDLNVSRLQPASLKRGGWEVAVIYRLRYYKYEPVTHKICPSYMK